jgi:methylated-DNA-[protein]-cysteine S-methyltransferase
MRISTRQARPVAGSASRREETYECDLGTGRLLLAGDLPLQHDLPDSSRQALPAAGPPSRWAGVLETYFAGRPVTFGLDVDEYADALGFTMFERDVYRALAAVPFGTVLSYRDLATAAGHPNAYRAAGSAMARNVLPVILPCHRVIRNDGRLGQYGDDPAWKERLLALEGVRLTKEERR